MPLDVTRDGVGTERLDLQTIFDTLATHIDPMALLLRLRDNRPVRVTFRDGTHGTVGWFTATGEPIALDNALAPLERTFRVGCTLAFQVHATAVCSARNFHHAKQVTGETLKKLRPMDDAFTLELDQDRLDAIQLALLKGDWGALHSGDVAVRINEVREV